MIPFIETLTVSGFHPDDFVMEFSPEDEEKKPEIPPPVWDDRPISGVRCMEATRALCG